MAILGSLLRVAVVMRATTAPRVPLGLVLPLLFAATIPTLFGHTPED